MRIDERDAILAQERRLEAVRGPKARELAAERGSGAHVNDAQPTLGGAIGLVSSSAGFALGLKAPADERKKKLIAAGIVFFLGFIQLRASGLLILLVH